MHAQHRGCLPELQLGDVPERSLYELALDNAVEGCIFESFSALKAQYQAQYATDQRILTTMKVIARDETNHAQLAWDIHHYLMAQLDESERLQILEAQREASQQLIEQTRIDSSRNNAAFGAPPLELVQSFVRQVIA